MPADPPNKRTRALLLGAFPVVAVLGLVLLLQDDDPPGVIIVCVSGLLAISLWALTMQLTRWKKR